MISEAMSDSAILRELGRRLKRRRLDQNISQQDLADRAGLNRTTIGKFERGASSSVLTLVQLLRALDALNELNLALPDPGLSPLQLARLRGRQRQRASRRNPTGDQGESEW